MSEAHRGGETPGHRDPKAFAGLTQRRRERGLPVGREQMRRPTGEIFAETDPENWPSGRPTFGQGR